MKAKAAKYTATFTRGEKGWVVQLKELPDCISQARTIEQGKERIRKALRAFIGDEAEMAWIDVEPTLPATVRKAIDRSWTERKRAAESASKAAESTAQAARALRLIGISTRDAGELLGISGQRVQQIESVGRGG